MTPDTIRQPARTEPIIIGLSAVLAAISIVFLARFIGNLPVMAAVAAGVVYLLSHVLRAFRVAVLSMDLLGISGRTASLMHLVTAPVALVLPFKSGELIRWHQLWRLSGSAVYAVIVLLIDRMFDSIFLVPILVLLLFHFSAPPALTLLTLLAAVVPLVVLVIGPRLLAEVQRYVVVNHNNTRALSVLGQIDALRLIVARAALVARRRALELSILSFLIWLCELAVCVIIVYGIAGASAGLGGNALELMGVRLVAPIWSLEAGSLAGIAIAISGIALLLPWPLMILFYLRRRKSEPSRVPADWHPETGVVP